MTQAADLIRDKRRLWAAPGGSHDRMVAVLAKWLPGAVGVVAAAMIVGPLFPRGEVSFLLDRNKVAITTERVRVSDAMYRGIDSQGRPFTVTAGNAAQVSTADPLVRMEDLAARIRLADGPAELTAKGGTYDYDRELVDVAGPVQFTAADGYRMTTSHVSINLRDRQVIGSGGVTGSIPAGTFSANRILADLGERTITLDGNARLQMAPGKLRMP
ncbi:MAG: LPS export ABC transporter periplasmic protein LptC [Novosphingobium sp.]|uniref:LPS export ABC transporter periplasmic protein LptC n=1 Tax=Novosphingobium sp. TaxID=1874826 RepID=UPI001D7AE9CE|nr:LPS export ABC transporter periplasmic protein LptC [Novosphingobium sp.]MCB2057735.1 LPS export ABC transporter periplasmic protein LptC [Novosphingobium sp.]MCP5386163.1 LPS export ABC transporter periplasmic protein LptC [Novosphingobium sp.]